MFQHTIEDKITFRGVGLHTGHEVTLSLLPAEPDTGIVFRRSDLQGFAIEACAAHIANVNYATTLMKKGVLISTVEHVLSALYGLNVDNAYIDLDDMEVPILDGSALPYAREINRIGLHRQEAPRSILRILQPIHHASGDKTISAEPYEGFEVTYVIDFPHPVIGRQETKSEISPDYYLNHLAPCRTFGFIREFEQLKENGLIMGGSLENAVVLSESSILNPEGLRCSNEPVLHKVMDFLGDVSLLGMPVLGRFHAYKGGHGLHAHLVKKILSHPDHYEIITPALTTHPAELSAMSASWTKPLSNGNPRTTMPPQQPA